MKDLYEVSRDRSWGLADRRVYNIESEGHEKPIGDSLLYVHKTDFRVTCDGDTYQYNNI